MNYFSCLLLFIGLFYFQLFCSWRLKNMSKGEGWEEKSERKPLKKRWIYRLFLWRHTWHFPYLYNSLFESADAVSKICYGCIDDCGCSQAYERLYIYVFCCLTDIHTDRQADKGNCILGAHWYRVSSLWSTVVYLE